MPPRRHSTFSASERRQFAAVGETGRGVGVGVAVRLALGVFMGIERVAKVLRAAPAEQDDRDVQEKGGLETGAGIRQIHAGNGRRNDLAAQADKHQDSRKRRAARNDMAGRQPCGFARYLPHVNHF